MSAIVTRSHAAILMLSAFWRVALVLVAAALLVGGAFAVQSYAIDRLLHDDAVVTAGQVGQVPRGQHRRPSQHRRRSNPPSADTLAFIARVKTVARVFLYKIYDSEGRPRFVSDDLPAAPGDSERLADHNPEALEAIDAPAIPRCSCGPA